MRLTRTLPWTSALVGLLFVGVAPVGCTAEASFGAQVETPPPPPPPPPPADTDGDGIPDGEDKCVNEKEDGKPPLENDGCPFQDKDGDGIADSLDKCPDEAETVNDFEDEDGCPDKKPLVQLVGTRVQINQKIQFKKASAAIEEDSKPVLDAVAEILKKHEDIQLVEVAGHASKEGNDQVNRQLTQKRVDAVVKELVARGVAKTRLVAQGFGAYCPVDTGDGEEALEKNRRVEFKILYRKGQPTEEVEKRGCEEATKKGVKPIALPKVPEWKEPEGDAKPGAEAKPAPEAKPAGN